MPRNCRNKGFTLVELLVVISIIALLIGILIPAIGKARRSARVAVDLANMRSHGIGAAAYTADNKGNMPNVPPGNGATGAGVNTTGPKQHPARFFGGELNPVLGWDWTGDGLAHANVWKAYNFVFGDYIVDGASGLDILNDVFISAGNTSGNYQNLRSVRPGDDDLPQFPKGYKSSGPGAEFIQSLFVTDADVDEYTDTGNIAFCQPDFAYTLTAVVGTGVQGRQNIGRYFWGKSTGGLPGSPTNAVWDAQGREWVNFRNYVKQSAFAHPSDKVMFWDPFASNSDRVRENGFYLGYMHPAAISPAVMVDGSARVTTPFIECLDMRITSEQQKMSKAFEAGDYVSTFFTWTGSQIAGPQPVPALFMTGIWGEQTRDFGGKGDD